MRLSEGKSQSWMIINHSCDKDVMDVESGQKKKRETVMNIIIESVRVTWIGLVSLQHTGTALKKKKTSLLTPFADDALITCEQDGGGNVSNQTVVVQKCLNMF